MRDPNRIDNILAAVGDVWKQYPDLRLGQLLVNVFPSMVIYYVEDEDLVKGVKRFYDNNND